MEPGSSNLQQCCFALSTPKLITVCKLLGCTWDPACSIRKAYTRGLRHTTKPANNHAHTETTHKSKILSVSSQQQSKHVISRLDILGQGFCRR